MKSDNEILRRFFDEARHPIPYDDFTACVLASIPEREKSPSIRRINFLLNVVAIAGSVILLVYMAVNALPDYGSTVSSPLNPLITMPGSDSVVTSSGPTYKFIATIIQYIVYLIVTIENYLVNIVLYIHKLPEQLPSPTQIIAVIAVVAILTVNAFRKPQHLSA